MPGDFDAAPYPWKFLRPDQPALSVMAECGELRTTTWWPVRTQANTVHMADEEGALVVGVTGKCSPTIIVGSMDDEVIVDDDVVYRVKLKAGEQPAMWDLVMISDQADGSVAALAAPALPGTNYACGRVVDYNPVSGGICHIEPVYQILNASLTTEQT